MGELCFSLVTNSSLIKRKKENDSEGSQLDTNWA